MTRLFHCRKARSDELADALGTVSACGLLWEESEPSSQSGSTPALAPLHCPRLRPAAMASAQLPRPCSCCAGSHCLLPFEVLGHAVRPRAGLLLHSPVPLSSAHGLALGAPLILHRLAPRHCHLLVPGADSAANMLASLGTGHRSQRAATAGAHQALWLRAAGAASLLGCCSMALPLCLFSLAWPLPLLLHLPVQAAAVAVMLRCNAATCAVITMLRPNVQQPLRQGVGGQHGEAAAAAVVRGAYCTCAAAAKAVLELEGMLAGQAPRGLLRLLSS